MAKTKKEVVEDVVLPEEEDVQEEALTYDNLFTEVKEEKEED